MPNRLDQFYRSLVFSKYFTKGWGKPENLKRICEFRKIVSNRETCYKLVSSDYPVYIEREEDGGYYNVIDGYFYTPFAHYLPEVVPVECRKAYFQMIVPKTWQSESYKPVILQIAGTGDQYYWRRRNLIAKPLLKDAGIGSIILENPFYGRRKPEEQIRTVLQNVCDIFVMGGCLIFESMVLFHLCERLGYGPLGVTGLSMGGHMASLIAACWPKPLVVVPCLSGTTSSHVFTEGVISRALNWDMLEEQFHSNLSYKQEIAKMINVNDKDAYRAGQEFAARASNYSSQMSSSLTDSSNEMHNLTNANHATETDDDEDHRSKRSHHANILNSKNNCTKFASTWSPSTPRPPHEITDNDLEASWAALCADTEKVTEDDSNKSIEKQADDKLSNRQQTARDASNLVGSAPAYNLYTCQLDKKFDVSDVTNGYSYSLLNYLAKFMPSSTTTTTASETSDSRAENFNAAAETVLSDRQALSFMNGIMDEVTHLKNYPVPVDTSLVIAVCADDDAYVPLKGMSKLDEVWPGAQVRYVKGGHVRAYVQYQKNFRLAIVDAFAKYRSTYLRPF
ncbi:protein ABHD18 [Planococcus citri]|uniref:protein ABHD18 n=1 Tax=Planococcus citri TaxID=170843 RepID=UPI0031F9186E